MNQLLQAAPADELPRLLFESLVPTEEGDDIDRAIATACGRWPALQPSLEGAAQLVRAQGVHETTPDAPELALVRLPAEWNFRAVSPTPTGLACTCDGWPPAMPAGPGDGLYCTDILAYLLALYLEHPPSPLPYTPEELWQATLEELRLQMTKATFNQWLLSSTVVPEASTPHRPDRCRAQPVCARVAHGPPTPRYCPHTGRSRRLSGSGLFCHNLILCEISKGVVMSHLFSLSRVRIHSHVTKSRFLHIEDALGIGKIRLFAGTYRRGEGLQQHAHYFIDIADARIVFGALARAEPGFAYREYKGTPTDNGAISRVLSVQVKGETVYIELKSGPGKLTPTGAVTPAGKAVHGARVEVNVGFKLYEARRMGAAVLAYLRAWDVMQMLEYRDAIGQPEPYLVVPATSEGMENGRSASAGVPQSTSSLPEETRPAEPHEHCRTKDQAQPLEKTVALTRARQTAEALFGPENGQPPPPAPLRYQDGSAVDEANNAEVQTFRRFVGENQASPASRAALQAYYRNRAAVH